MSDIGIIADNNNFAPAISSAYGTSSVAPLKESNQGQEEQKQIKNDDIEDTATISEEAKALYEADKAQKTAMLNKSEQKEEKSQQENSEKNILVSDKQNSNETNETKQTEKPTKNDTELTQAEKEQISNLKSRDAEVKAHEQAHRAAAAGINASAASYTYEVGPDGNRYAVAGEVNISFREGSNPEENIQNAKAMKAAALAPAQPSGQDLSVARHADQLVAQYTKELAQIEDAEIATDENKTTEDNSINNNNKQTTSTTNNVKENEQNQPVNMLNNDDKQALSLDLSKEAIKTSQINNINLNDMTSRQKHPIFMP